MFSVKKMVTILAIFTLQAVDFKAQKAIFVNGLQNALVSLKI